MRRRFPAWNLAGAAGVTAWFCAAALALTCLGALPGAFYAILVSAHACASLVEDPPAG